MGIEENKAVVRTLMENFNARDLDKAPCPAGRRCRMDPGRTSFAASPTPAPRTSGTAQNNCAASESDGQVPLGTESDDGRGGPGSGGGRVLR